MISKLLTLLLVISACSISVHKLSTQSEEEIGLSEEYNVQVERTSNKRIVKFTQYATLELLAVPYNINHQGSTTAHCSIQSVIQYFQIPLEEQIDCSLLEIRPEDFNQQNFTSTDLLIKLAQVKTNIQTNGQNKILFGFITQQNMQPATLERSINNGNPVIILISKKFSRESSYAIIIGYDNNNYYFQDPQVSKSVGFLPKNQLESIWLGFNSKDQLITRFGLIITLRKNTQRSGPSISPSRIPNPQQ